jgi:asparagine synthase (glutamine-hydrolysing)
MCGIAGILHRDPNARPDREALARMQASLNHRGPDDRGMHVDGGVALVHTRLSIIDVEGGKQPMSNEDGSVWVAFNGEIYNYLELRRDLVGRHKFKTHSDTEVLVHLYEEMGERMLERLNGMFAFAIWDAREKRLFAARDRMGIKPFYWHANRELFAFASEPKAIFASGVAHAERDSDGLEQYLYFQFCLRDQTLFKDVKKLEPGHWLSFRPYRDAEPQVVRYWDFRWDVDTHHTEEYYADQLLLLLQDSVRLQLRSDVPVGAHLSGGMDSSTVVCLAAEPYGGEFHTFTGAFADGPQYDETRYARAVADHVGSVHHEVWPTAAEFADAMPKLVYAMDEPAAGPGLFPQYCVSKLAREHVKVVLGGQGGDEIFGGYARYLVAYLEQVLKGAIFGGDQGKYVVSWDSIHPNLGLLRQYKPMLQTFWKEGLFEDMDRRYFRLIGRAEDADGLFSTEVWGPGSRERLFAGFQRLFNHIAIESYFNKMTHFDLKTLLPSLLQVEDRTSMSVSLESRVPLLDHRIADLITRMPPTIRFQGGDTKRVFREAVRRLLPAVILERKDKMGFPVPLNEWVRGPLRDFVADHLLSRRARERGLYQMDAVEALVNGERAFGRQVWGLLNLELWHRAFIDGERPTLGAA